MRQVARRADRLGCAHVRLQRRGAGGRRERAARGRAAPDRAAARARARDAPPAPALRAGARALRHPSRGAPSPADLHPRPHTFMPSLLTT